MYGKKWKEKKGKICNHESEMHCEMMILFRHEVFEFDLLGKN